MSRARRTFASLAQPRYRRYFVGHVTTVLGFWIRLVIQGWLVYELTGNRALLGAITAVSMLPLAVLSPFGGILADRLDRRRMLILLPLVAVAANVVLGVLVLSGRIRVEHIFIAAGIIGVARALEMPARNAFVRDLVGLEDLANAVALNAAGFNLGRIVGPSLAAASLYWFGMGESFLIAAVANAGLPIALLGIRVAEQRSAPTARGPFRQLAEGVAYVRGHRRTRTLMILLGITVVCLWAYQTQLVAFSRDLLGLDDKGYALLMSVPGLGAIVGALWVAGRGGGRSQRALVFGVIAIGALAVSALGLFPHLAVVVPALFLAGFAQLSFMVSGNAMVQESVPDALRGRVMGLWIFVFGACFPLGSLLVGVVAQHVSIQAAWLGGAAGALALSAWVYLRLPRRGTTESAPVTDPAAS